MEVQISRTDRLRELFRSLFGAPKHENIISDNFDENYCEDRCVIHPSNRFTCGKARSADQCQAVGCCWDDNAQHCYKEACKFKPVIAISLMCQTYNSKDDSLNINFFFEHADVLMWHRCDR